MKTEEILKRLEEIEAHMNAARNGATVPPFLGWDQVSWLCQVVRELLGRLDAAKEFLGAMQRFKDKLVCDICGKRLERGMVYCVHESCWKAREARLRTLEAVAEAAREYAEYDQLAPEGTPARRAYKNLCEALAALEEGSKHV